MMNVNVNLVRITITIAMCFSLLACVASDDPVPLFGSDIANTGPTSDSSNSAEVDTVDTVDTVIHNIDYDLHGKWIYVNRANEEGFSIYSNSTYTYDRINSDLISILLTDGSYEYAMRAGISAAQVSGRLVSTTAVVRSGQISTRFSGIGGIGVILQNIDDPAITTNATSDADGTFTTNDTVPAGTYTLSVPDTTTQQVVIVDDEAEDLGTYGIVGDTNSNFKMDFELIESDFIFADNKQYHGNIVVENISDFIGLGLSYDITITDPSLAYFKSEIVLGSILAGGVKKIPVVLRFNDITETTHIITINVTVTDVNNFEWQQDLELSVFKEKFYVNIRSNTAKVNGYIILPFSNKVIKIDTQSDSIVLPVISDQYQLLLSNPSIETESVYSLGVQRSASLSIGFNEPSAYEPNNISSGAATIEKGEQVESYLHVGDLDYWKISASNLYDENTNSTGYTAITANGDFLADTYYYLNLSDKTYFDFTQLSGYGNYLTISDINLESLYSKFISTSGTNYGIPAGEYLIKHPTDFNIFGSIFSDLNFPKITADGTYLANTYYYLNLTDKTYFDFTQLSGYGNYLTISDINLESLYSKFISTSGTNYGIPAGEYLIKHPTDFSIIGF